MNLGPCDQMSEILTSRPPESLTLTKCVDAQNEAFIM